MLKDELRVPAVLLQELVGGLAISRDQVDDAPVYVRPRKELDELPGSLLDHEVPAAVSPDGFLAFRGRADHEVPGQVAV